MAFRSKQAQYVHTQVVQYIANKCEVSDVGHAIATLDSKTLKETSINGHTHLIDVLRLPFVQKFLNARPADKSIFLMKALIDQAKALDRSSQQKGLVAYLLLGRDLYGYSSLHAVLQTGDPDVPQVYLEIVWEAFREQLISKADYISLLTGHSKTGYSPLNSVLRFGHPSAAQAYLEMVQEAVKNKWINSEDYSLLLTAANMGGFTPLHSADGSGSLGILELFMHTLEQHFDNSPEKILACFEQKNRAGYVPASNKNKDNACEIDAFLAVKKLVYKGGVSLAGRAAHEEDKSRGDRKRKREDGSSYTHRNADHFVDAPRFFKRPQGSDSRNKSREGLVSVEQTQFMFNRRFDF